jgi:hypothetical protein
MDPFLPGPNTHSLHDEFSPVKQWIIQGNGRIVYGGSKYRAELQKMGRYMKLFLELKKAGKVSEIKDEIVDRWEQSLLQQGPKGGFNDQHIVAIFIVSHCRLFCSHDEQAYRHIKNKSLYPVGHKIPKIYRCREHRNLLCNAFIVKLQNTVG